MNSTELRRLVDIKKISESIGITKSGIFNLMKAGKFPKGIKIGSARRWDIDDVNNWLKSQNKGLKKECDSAC